MPETPHKHCCGKMFPHGQRHHVDGKAFKLREVGPVGMWVRSRVLETDLAEWDDCRSCAEFPHCSQLCMARIALETIANHE